MRKKSAQPARKSYFFGQGYRDILDAIRLSWVNNAKTADKYYSKFRIAGAMSLSGVFNLFCALSVVIFGTIFFAVISFGALSVVSVFFVLVYLGCSLAWLLDRLYLSSHKIFTACHECKSRFLIPIYICPGCGAQHTNLTPGPYGILHRTCNCGQKLPTTFFNGRKKLQAICPACEKQGVRTYLNDRESRPLCVPIVGGRSVGKTAYITAFSRQFVDFVAPQRGLEIEFYNQAKSAIYDQIKADYIHGTTRMTDRPQDVSKASSVSFSFFVKHKSLKPERLVHIYDIAGEVFTQNSENEIQQQYEYCQGIIFMLDPFAIPAVRARSQGKLPPKDMAGIGTADINGIIDVFLNKLREVTGLSDRAMSKVPLAVVISKTDSAQLSEQFSVQRIEELRFENPDVRLDRHDAVDHLCRQFLRDNGMGSFLNTIAMKFKTNRFFACSAIGHTREGGIYNPTGVMEPMEWICSLADRELADLWVTETFSQRPPEHLKDVEEF